MSQEPDYVVVRVAPSVPKPWPARMDGWWYDLSTFHSAGLRSDTIRMDEWVATPTGRFEVREDGAVAEVWEVQHRC